MTISSHLSILFVIISTIHQPVLCQNQTGPVVTLSTGKIVGKSVTTNNGNDGIVFLGVPYAKKPVGELRYHKPVAVEKWQGILKTEEYSAACLSNTSITTSPQNPISEDCLYINVYSSENCSNCPVVYYIHGGGFFYDSPRQFDPTFLIDNFASNGVIMVIVGYRLGSFGFFNTGTYQVDRNVGMHDIILGLEWTQNEIGAFGGDKTKVTLLGHSSGASGVGLLSMSPKTTGLFSGIIQMSGTPFEMKTIKDVNLNGSKTLAIRANCATEETWSAGQFGPIIACLKAKDALELLEIQRQMSDGLLDTVTWFMGPTSDGENGLFPQEAITDMAKNRQVLPMMLGTTLGDGLLPVAADTLVDLQCDTFCKDYKHPPVVSQLCKEHYAGSNSKQLEKDASAFVPTYKDAVSLRDRGPTTNVYLYSFDYGPRSFHSGDLTLIMGLHKERETETAMDKIIRRLYLNFFLNFAKSRKPTLTSNKEKWTPLKRPTGYNYYSIDYADNGDLQIRPKNKDFYHFDAIQFWMETVPAADKGASIFETQKQSQESDKSVAIRVGFWQTLFWIMLCLLIIAILAMVISAVIKYGKQKKGSKEENEEFNRLIRADSLSKYGST